MDGISVTVKVVLGFNNRIVVCPSLRSAVLPDLHSGHLGAKEIIG